jgi:hypothetical protein
MGDRPLSCFTVRRKGKMRNEWYFWGRNRYAHFIVFHDREQRVASTKVTPLSDGTFGVLVDAPSWPRFNFVGSSSSLEEAKATVDERVMAIIGEAFKPEYRPPLG